MNFAAHDIVEICSGTLLLGNPDNVASSCYIDSRKVSNGSLFAAFIGERDDGHKHIGSALREGASVVLVSRNDIDYTKFDCGAAIIRVDDVLTALQELGRHQRSLISCPVIGITGSSGKTSTKELLKGALEACLPKPGAVVATEGNLNNELGVPLTLLRTKEDTEVVVVEMGMRGLGQITELTQIAHPSMSIITTIGDAHIEMLGSRENIAKAKGEIFEALNAEQLAFMPADVDFGDYLRSVSKAALITVLVEGEGKQQPNLNLLQEAAYHARILDFDKDGNASSQLTFPTGEEFTLKLAIPGEHSVQNALLALAVVAALGLDAHTALKGLENTQAAEMRMQRCLVSVLSEIEDANILVDCYNANPESTTASLKTLAVARLSKDQGKRIAVLGDMLEMGSHCPKAHKNILLLAGMLNIDLVYTFGKAYERATREVLDELHTGRSLENFPELRSLTDMDLLISSLASEITSGSLILVKGSRSMQMERVVKALTITEKEGDSPC
jgi:UDP-N-acetylmuramoyl-tripeptide--D-alanyl-D-alanine ligase